MEWYPRLPRAQSKKAASGTPLTVVGRVDVLLVLLEDSLTVELLRRSDKILKHVRAYS